MARALVVIGIVFVAAGLLWPVLARLGFGRLPGDIRIVRDGFVFYFPLTSGLLASAVVSLVVWLLRR